jgi:hypothetical protein
LRKLVWALLVINLLLIGACSREQYYPFGKGMRLLYPYDKGNCQNDVYGEHGRVSKTVFDKTLPDSSYWIGYYPDHKVRFYYRFLIDTCEDFSSIPRSNLLFTWFCFYGYEYFSNGNKKCFRQINYGRRSGEWVWFNSDGEVIKKVNYGSFKK